MLRQARIKLGRALMMLEAAVCALTLMALPLLPAAVIGWVSSLPTAGIQYKRQEELIT